MPFYRGWSLLNEVLLVFTKNMLTQRPPRARKFANCFAAYGTTETQGHRQEFGNSRGEVTVKSTDTKFDYVLVGNPFVQ